MMKTGLRARLLWTISLLFIMPIKTLNYNLFYYNWTHTEDPISGEVLVAFENTLDCTGERNAIAAAADAWNLLGANFHFPDIQIGNPQTFRGIYNDGKNQIGWVQYWEYGSDQIAVTILWSQLSSNRIIEVDKVFDDRRDWITQLPKPEAAFDEWSNVRLVLDKLNNYKGESTSVADPMAIQAGWFAINFHNFYVVPGTGLPRAVRQLITTTITTLRFNSDDSLVNQGFEIVKEYARGDVSLDFLRRKFPFIAAELERQSLTKAIKPTFN